MNLRVKYLVMYCQFSIYERIFGGMVEFEFEFAYKLRVVVQRKTLFILRISMLCCLVHMNHEYFESLIAGPAFDKFLELDRKIIIDINVRTRSC